MVQTVLVIIAVVILGVAVLSIHYRWAWKRVIQAEVDSSVLARSIIEESPDQVAELPPDYRNLSGAIAGRTVSLGVIFALFAEKSHDLERVLNVYDVRLVSELAVTSSPTLIDIVRRTANGYRTVPPLTVVRDQNAISSWLSRSEKFVKENLSSFVGGVGEVHVAQALLSKGIAVEVPSLNAPGFDLLVDPDWLASKVKGSLDPGERRLQVKTVTSKSAIYRHFRKYLDKGELIPTAAPDSLIEEFKGHKYQDYLIPFSEVGLPEKDALDIIRKGTTHDLALIESGNMDQLISKGTDNEIAGRHVDVLIGGVICAPLLKEGFTFGPALFELYLSNSKPSDPTVRRQLKRVVGRSVGRAAGGVGAGALAYVMMDRRMKKAGHVGVKDAVGDGMVHIRNGEWGEAIPGMGVLALIYLAGELGSQLFDGVRFMFATRKARSIEKRVRLSLRALAVHYGNLSDEGKEEVRQQVYGPYHNYLKERLNHFSSELRAQGINIWKRLFPPPYTMFLTSAYADTLAVFHGILQERGEMIRAFEMLKNGDPVEFGAFLYEYNEVLFPSPTQDILSLVGDIKSKSTELAAELRLLRQEGVDV